MEVTEAEAAVLLSLKAQGLVLRLDDMDRARAFVAHMPEGNAERLIQACLERGRPRGIAVRVWAAARASAETWKQLVEVVNGG